ncbi:MAG: bifunctional nuclease family protein [Xanthomonadales bacterium]|nr:bifunctional nuclease family protein [Xanthomonadales bacterium]
MANRTRVPSLPGWAAALLLAVCLAAPLQAREPAVAEEQLQAASIVGLVELPGGAGAAVGLQADNDDDQRVVAIFIGGNEAAAIARAQQGVRPMRPLTHELLGDLLTAGGIEIVQLVIDDLRDGVYYATLQVRMADGQKMWIDTRPSDGLVLAVREDSPIRLAPVVMASSPDWTGPDSADADEPAARRRADGLQSL